MAWRVIGNVIRNLFLALLEYGLKISAFLGALIAIGSGQTFLDKAMAGCASLASVFLRLPEAYDTAVEAGRVIRDHNALDAATLTELHGSSAADGVMQMLNEASLYVYSVNQNFLDAPLATTGAALLVFAMFFGTGWLLRIARQGHDDLFWVRVEKKIWSMMVGEKQAKKASRSAVNPSVEQSTGQDERIPELEIETLWNPAPKQEKNGQIDAGSETESQSIPQLEGDVAGITSNGEDNDNIQEFNASTEALLPDKDHRENGKPSSGFTDDEDTEETDEFDLESELKSAMGDDVPHKKEDADAPLVEEAENRDEMNSAKRGHKQGTKTSKKTPLSEKINKAKKSKRHSLEEFLKMARSSE